MLCSPAPAALLLKPSSRRVRSANPLSRDSRFFAHRVIRVDHNCDEPILIVRGDTLVTEDSPVRSAEILGRIVSVERGGKLIDASRTRRLSQRTLAWALRRSDLLIVATLHLHFLRARISSRFAGRAIPSSQESF